MSILDGCRVIDLADEKGLLCSRLLADMGAEVIRIQKPGEEVSQVYANFGKRCISLNIENQAGRRLLMQFVPQVDVIVESFSPGYLDSLGLGYPALSRINPRLILASITGFGQTGPDRLKKSSDLVASASGGQLYVCGEPGQPPLKPYGSQTYFTACLFAANGILLALWRRHTSGKGQQIDISIHECVAATLDHVLVRYFAEGEVAQRQGSLYWNKAFRIFPCRDGHILLSLFQNWNTLVEWLASEGMAADLSDRKWMDPNERENNIDHIIDVLEKWTLSHTVNELLEIGQLMRFPWANVASISEVVSSPQLNERGYFVEAFDPDSGKRYKFPGSPVKMSASPWEVSSGIPRTGEYNREFYLSVLGLTEKEFGRLIEEGVI